MKRYLFIILFLFISSIAFSQITGGGKTQSSPSSPSVKKSKNYMFYMEAGLSTPLSDLGDKNKVGGKSGFYGGIGTAFYISQNMPIPDDIKFGIDVTWGELYVLPMEISGGSSDATQIGLLMGSQIGGIFSYLPSNLGIDIGIDGFIGLTPTFGFFNYYNPDAYDSYEIEDMTWLGIGVRKTIGANLRLSNFYAGFDYTFGKIEYDVQIEFEDAGKSKIKTNTFNLKVGLAF